MPDPHTKFLTMPRDLGDAVDDRAVAKIDLLVVDHECS